VAKKAVLFFWGNEKATRAIMTAISKVMRPKLCIDIYICRKKVNSKDMT